MAPNAIGTREKRSQPDRGAIGAILSPWFISVLLLAITLAHHEADPQSGALHNILRRLYYVPIILAAFVGGARWGGIVALGAAALYFPHAFLMTHHGDPAPTVEKALEMALFVAIGVLTGSLVTRERRAVDARQAAESRAARLESLVTLTSGLAHEIKNPLASIQGALEILSDDHPVGSAKRPILDVGMRETTRLDGVIQEFIGFARPRELELAPADLGELAERVCRAADVAREGVSVRCVRPAVPTRATVDGEQLERCLGNLVLNAVQWSPEGGEVGVTVVSSTRIVIEDAGPGVPERDRERIFDPYFTRRAQGTGLGLPMAARIAAAHGGSVHYEVRKPAGSRFVLELGGAAHAGGRAHA